MVSGSRSTTQSSDLADSPRGINLAEAESCSSPRAASRAGDSQPLHSSGTESRFVLVLKHLSNEL
jgi:hypothetical protein